MKKLLKQGHLYIAFGNDYMKCAYYSILQLRKFSKLPVHILTNISNDIRKSYLDKLSNISYTTFDAHENNRNIKTNMIQYTPFEETLFTDCDTLVFSKLFKTAFDSLKFYDIAFPCHTIDESYERMAQGVFQEAVRDFDMSVPFLIYQGGCCVFKKNKQVEAFFELWNKYWQVRKFRDMPPLAAAIQKSQNTKIGILSRDFGFSDSKIIQHYYGYDPFHPKELPNFIKLWPNEYIKQYQPRIAFRK